MGRRAAKGESGMILDAKERERLAQRARELFAAEPVDYAAAVPVPVS